MTRKGKSTTFNDVLELLGEEGLESAANVMQVLLNAAMKLERERFLGAKSYERSDSRRGYANGFKPKTVKSRIGQLQLDIPQVRDTRDGESFYPSALERGLRSERAFKISLAEMYVQGVSTRKVAAITKELCGFEVTSDQVSRASKELDKELKAWRDRPLGSFEFLILDARYEDVRQDGTYVSSGVLIAIGVDSEGKRTILGTSVKLSEAEVHWRDFLQSLVKRGLHGVRYIVSDDHQGLRAARKAVFPSVPWQRCQVHLQKNAASYVLRKSMRRRIARELRTIFNAPSLTEAKRLLADIVRKYEQSNPQLSGWLETAVPEGFTVFSLPSNQRSRMRSTNMLERLNQEIKRRTTVVRVFPNEASVLRLVSALLMEQDEEWQYGRRYLPKAEPDSSS